MKKFHFLDEFWPPCNQNPFLNGNLFSLSLSLCSSSLPEILFVPFSSISFILVLPLVLWLKVFLFARARIATDDEGVLLFPRDLHKISILRAASREKYRRVTRARWWIPPTEAGPSRFNVYGTRHKREIVIFTARSDFAVASRILSPFNPPRPIFYIADPPANSRSSRRRFTWFPALLFLYIVSSCSMMVL